MKPPLKYGLYTGLISGIWVICCFAVVNWFNSSMDLHIPAKNIRAYSGLLSIMILVLGIFTGMRQVKHQNGWQISYGQAVKTGILISLITGIIVAVFSFLYCTVINPGYAAYMTREAEKAMIAANKSAEEIKLQLENVKKEFSTPMQVIMALGGQIVVGTISSLILGLLIRNKKNQL